MLLSASDLGDTPTASSSQQPQQATTSITDMVTRVLAERERTDCRDFEVCPPGYFKSVIASSSPRYVRCCPVVPQPAASSDDRLKALFYGPFLMQQQQGIRLPPPGPMQYTTAQQQAAAETAKAVAAQLAAHQTGRWAPVRPAAKLAPVSTPWLALGLGALVAAGLGVAWVASGRNDP